MAFLYKFTAALSVPYCRKVLPHHDSTSADACAHVGGCSCIQTILLAAWFCHLQQASLLRSMSMESNALLLKILASSFCGWYIKLLVVNNHVHLVNKERCGLLAPCLTILHACLRRCRSAVWFGTRPVGLHWDALSLKSSTERGPMHIRGACRPTNIFPAYLPRV